MDELVLLLALLKQRLHPFLLVDQVSLFIRAGFSLFLAQLMRDRSFTPVLKLTRAYNFVCFCVAGSPVGCRIYTAKINMTESFLASVEDLYNTFTEKEVSS